jgi:hypothetical protein
MIRLSHRALAAVAAALILATALAGCGAATSPGPTVDPSPPGSPSSPSPSAPEGSADAGASPTPGATSSSTLPPDLAAEYATIERQVQEIRGLRATGDVPKAVLDENQLKDRVEADFASQASAEHWAASTRLLRGMGLLGPTQDAQALTRELLESQIAGFYDTDTHELYVIARSGEPGPTEKVTFAHEFNHALQDQSFDLDRLELAALDQTDRSTARLSLIEGDATLVMTLWTVQGLTPQEALRMLGESLDPASTEVLARMPAVLSETLMFPYQDGMSFVSAIRERGGWEAVNRAFDAPPDSTEQILHPEKFFAREAPVAVSLPADLASRMGSGWASSLEDTLGELQWRIWLDQAGDRQQSSAAAAGWGGDRIALLEGPSGRAAIVALTAWDTTRDAGEFASRAETVARGLGGSTKVIPGAGDPKRVAIIIASDAGTVASVEGALGL